MRQGVFSGLLSAGFSPGRNFAEFQKMRAEGVLAKFAMCSALRALRDPRFAAKCFAMWALEAHVN